MRWAQKVASIWRQGSIQFDLRPRHCFIYIFVWSYHCILGYPTPVVHTILAIKLLRGFLLDSPVERLWDYSRPLHLEILVMAVVWQEALRGGIWVAILNIVTFVSQRLEERLVDLEVVLLPIQLVLDYGSLHCEIDIIQLVLWGLHLGLFEMQVDVEWWVQIIRLAGVTVQKHFMIITNNFKF